MEFIDSCITLSIKQYHITPASNFFTKSFTVIPIQNYEVSLKFHSKQFTRFLRYSQFSILNSKIPDPNLPLPPFPQKNLLKPLKKLSDSRKILLEKWLQGLLSYPTTTILLLEFLTIPQPVIFSVKSGQECLLSPLEQIIARFVRKIGNIEKPREKILKEFKEEIFKTNEFTLSKSRLGCFFESFSPLCGIQDTACEAVDVLFNMLRNECFHSADIVKDVFLGNIKWIKMIKLDKHVMNEFERPTSMQGIYIMKLVKEYFDRNYMFKQEYNAMNGNEKALEKVFGEKVMGMELNEAVNFVARCEWNWLSTGKFYKDIKIGFRKVDEWVEIKARVNIAIDLLSLLQLVWDVRKRKSWDLYLQDFTVIQKSSNRCQVHYNIKVGRKPTLKLLLDTERVEKNEKVKIFFKSLKGAEEIAKIKGCYKLKKIEAKKRTGSSSTDDIECSIVENQPLTSSSLSNIFKDNSKLQLKLKMTPDMAKHIVSDLSEETSYFKESLRTLKESAELLNNY